MIGDGAFEADELEDLVDRIQIGDRTEGAQAIRQIMERSGGSRDIGAEVRRVHAQDRVRGEIQSALTAFHERYPDLVQDDLVAQSGLTAIGREIEKDLKEMGVTDEALGRVRGNDGLMLQAYTEMRTAGKGRPPEEIFGAVGDEMSKRYGFRARGTARVGGVRRVNGADPDVEAREQEKRREAIYNMRAARGYRTDDATVAAPVRGAGVDRSDKQREATRAYIAKRNRRDDEKRNGVRNQNPDAY
jgi:hypothetical protein